VQNNQGDQPNQTENDAAAEREADLTQLKERLAFYESFDQLIHDNISRAGELLREAASKRNETELALRNSTAEIERRQLEDRIGYRKVFAGLLDQIQTVQQNVERLAREVSDTLDDLEAGIPAAGELAGEDLPPLPTFGQETSGSLASGLVVSNGDSAPEADRPEKEQIEPIDEFVTADEAIDNEESGYATSGIGSAQNLSEVLQASVERVSASYASPDPESIPVPDEDDDIDGEIVEDAMDSIEVEVDDFDVSPEEPFRDSSAGEDMETAAADPQPITAATPESDPVAGEEWIDGSDSASTTLLVHGVPRATTALSLKRYLEGLAQVHAVEPREYAEGVLRLQVSSETPIGLDDLRGWPEAVGLEAVSVQPDFVEVKLPQ
jgi:hypothetical protein